MYLYNRSLAKNIFKHASNISLTMCYRESDVLATSNQSNIVSCLLTNNKNVTLKFSIVQIYFSLWASCVSRDLAISNI